MKLLLDVPSPKIELKFFLAFVVLFNLVMRLLKIATSGKWSLFVLQATGSYKIIKYCKTPTIPLWVSLHNGRKCLAYTCRVGTFHVTVICTSLMSTGQTIDRYFKSLVGLHENSKSPGMARVIPCSRIEYRLSHSNNNLLWSAVVLNVIISNF